MGIGNIGCMGFIGSRGFIGFVGLIGFMGFRSQGLRFRVYGFRVYRVSSFGECMRLWVKMLL